MNPCNSGTQSCPCFSPLGFSTIFLLLFSIGIFSLSFLFCSGIFQSFSILSWFSLLDFFNLSLGFFKIHLFHITIQGPHASILGKLINYLQIQFDKRSNISWIYFLKRLHVCIVTITLYLYLSLSVDGELTFRFETRLTEISLFCPNQLNTNRDQPLLSEPFTSNLPNNQLNTNRNNEAYLRLLRTRSMNWQNKAITGHFLALSNFRLQLTFVLHFLPACYLKLTSKTIRDFC